MLGRVFQMRRLTWTFVSQNAQVVGFDGRTLTLGIATEGLTTTFRAGNHAEVVRQALIDQLGIDALVDGIHVSDGSVQQTPPGPPPGSVPPPDSSGEGGVLDAAVPDGQPSRPPDSQPGVGRASQPGDAGPDRGSSPTGRAPSAMADAGLSPSAGGRSLEENAGWGSVSAPAPDWATAAPTPAASAPKATASTAPAASQHKTRNTASGATAVRASLDAARRSPQSSRTEAAPRSSTDDSAVSDDDEVIEVSTDVGRAVIEKVLGGRLLQEYNE